MRLRIRGFAPLINAIEADLRDCSCGGISGPAFNFIQDDEKDHRQSGSWVVSRDDLIKLVLELVGGPNSVACMTGDCGHERQEECDRHCFLLCKDLFKESA